MLSFNLQQLPLIVYLYIIILQLSLKLVPEIINELTIKLFKNAFSEQVYYLSFHHIAVISIFSGDESSYCTLTDGYYGRSNCACKGFSLMTSYLSFLSLPIDRSTCYYLLFGDLEGGAIGFS